MKIRIGEREYPVIGHRSANLLHLIELREHTRGLFAEPLGMARLDEIERVAKVLRGRIAATQDRRAAALEAGDDAAVAAADEQLERLRVEQVDDGLLGMAIVIFLSRRKAGDRVTFAQAVDVDIADEVEWISEPDDALPVVPAAGDGVPLDGAVGAAPDPLSPALGSRETSAGDPVPAPRRKGGKRTAGKAGRSTTSGSR